MNKEFILYEQALALKELGFDEPCMGYYEPNKEFNYLNWEKFKDLPYLTKNSEWQDLVGAPLYQQAFRWFREKYGLFGYSYPNDYQKYGYRIVLVKNPENQELVYDWGTKDAPEEAELACLNKLIEILKNERS